MSSIVLLLCASVVVFPLYSNAQTHSPLIFLTSNAPPMTTNTPSPYYLTAIVPNEANQALSVSSANSTTIFRLSDKAYEPAISSRLASNGAGTLTFLHTTIIHNTQPQSTTYLIQTLTVNALSAISTLSSQCSSGLDSAQTSLIIGDLIFAPTFTDFDGTVWQNNVQDIVYVAQYYEWYALSVDVINFNENATFHMFLFKDFTDAFANNEAAPPPVYSYNVNLGPRVSARFYESLAFTALYEGAVDTLLYASINFGSPNVSNWLVTFNLTDNTLIHNVSFPDKNEWPLSIQSQIIYSSKRQTLFAVIMGLDVPNRRYVITAVVAVDPTTGKWKTVVSGATFPPIYPRPLTPRPTLVHVLDDANGIWWLAFGPSNPDTEDLNIVGVNLDSGQLTTATNVALPDKNAQVLGLYK